MEWISVKDKDPEQHQKIMAIDPNGEVHTGMYYMETGKICLPNSLVYRGGGCVCDLEEHYTHWMPLPEPPNT